MVKRVSRFALFHIASSHLISSHLNVVVQTISGINYFIYFISIGRICDSFLNTCIVFPLRSKIALEHIDFHTQPPSIYHLFFRSFFDHSLSLTCLLMVQIFMRKKNVYTRILHGTKWLRRI